MVSPAFAAPSASALRGGGASLAKAPAGPAAQDASPQIVHGAWAPLGASAALLAVGSAASRRTKKSAAGAPRAPRVLRKLQGGVETVRIVNPGYESGLLHQALDGCRTSTVVDGVMKFAFMVPKQYAGSKEEFELGKGTTENVYVLYDKGGSPDSGPLTLIDVPEARFMSVFMEKMAGYLTRLQSIVLTHVGGEEVEVLLKLCEEVEKASGTKLKVYTSEKGKSILTNAIGDEANGLDVELIDDDSFISCRSEGRLDAVCTSTGKYPDLMNVFDEATGTLFSGKFFAAHDNYELPSEDFDPSWADTSKDWHHYFDCNFFTEAAQEGVRRIFQITADNADDGVGLSNPDVERLAPFHGPVVRSQSWKLMAKYEAWLERKMQNVTDGKAVILYASAYSNTFKMAEAVASGLEKQGVSVDLLNVEFTDAKELKAAVKNCDGFAVGSPTLGGQMPIQMKEALGIVLKSGQGGQKQGGMRASGSGAKPCGAFGSFGWSGEAPEECSQRLKDGGFDVAFDALKCKFTPTPEMIEQCEAAGAALAQRISKAKDAQKKAMLAAEQGAGASKLQAKSKEELEAGASMMKAFGQIINSSCVLTFASGEDGAEGIRVPVSWVSQASFTPPGLMIAIEKKSLDAWITTTPEEQLDALFLKYDADGSGELDREEVDPMLTEMFGAEVGSAQEEMLKAKKDEAWKILDDDGSGAIDRAEFISAATKGPFAEMLQRERKMASLESVLGDSEAALQFALCMLPEGMTESDAMSASQHKKKKSKNGCTVLDGCTSFVECKVKSIMSAGASSIIYAEIEQGDLVEDGLRTELVRANHVAIDHEAQDSAASKQEAAAEETTGEPVPA